MQHSDMNEEMRTEAMELCVTACEKHGSNNEVSSHTHPYSTALRTLSFVEILYNLWYVFIIRMLLR